MGLSTPTMKSVSACFVFILSAMVLHAADLPPDAVPKFKANITCFNSKIDSRSSCSGPASHRKDTPTTLSCGYPEHVSEITSTFIEHRNGKDVYRITHSLPLSLPKLKPTTKTVEFSNKRIVVFEDQMQVIVIEPR